MIGNGAAAMSSSNHFERVTAWLQSELGHTIQRELSDPRVGMVSVTGLCLSRDCRRAEIYVTAIGHDSAESAKEVVDVLNGASGYLQSRLAAAKRLRTVPRLKFYYDPGVEQGRRIDSLMAEMHEMQVGPSAADSGDS